MNYLGRPVLTLRPDFDQLDHGQLDDFVYESKGFGLATPWKATDRTKRAFTFPFLLSTKQELKDMRVFFETVRGSGDGFWLPLYVNELPIAADVLAGDLEATVDGRAYYERFQLGAQFRHVALVDRDKISVHGVYGVETLGANQLRLLLVDGPSEGYRAQDSVLCMAAYCRLDGSKITYEYSTNAVARVTLDFTELPAEAPNPTGAPGTGGTPLICTKPIYLYKFTRGNQVWRYCNFGVNIAAGGSLWQAENISHGKIEAGSEFLESGLEIFIGTDNPNHPLCYYLDRTNTDPTEVEVWRTDADTFIVESSPVYVGRLGSVRGEREGEINTEVSSVLRYGETEVPRPKNQRLCNHQLGDEFCQVNLLLFSASGNLSAVNPGYVEAAAIGAKVAATGDPNFFALGRITVGTETRFITGTNGGSRVYINLPFKNAQVGNAFNAIAGDDKRATTCDGKFHNIENFLANPYGPNKHPQFKALETPQPSGGKK